MQPFHNYFSNYFPQPQAASAAPQGTSQPGQGSPLIPAPMDPVLSELTGYSPGPQEAVFDLMHMPLSPMQQAYLPMEASFERLPPSLQSWVMSHDGDPATAQATFPGTYPAVLPQGFIDVANMPDYDDLGHGHHYDTSQNQPFVSSPYKQAPSPHPGAYPAGPFGTQGRKRSASEMEDAEDASTYSGTPAAAEVAVPGENQPWPNTLPPGTKITWQDTVLRSLQNGGKSHRRLELEYHKCTSKSDIKEIALAAVQKQGELIPGSVEGVYRFDNVVLQKEHRIGTVYLQFGKRENGAYPLKDLHILIPQDPAAPDRYPDEERILKAMGSGRKGINPRPISKRAKEYRDQNPLPKYPFVNDTLKSSVFTHNKDLLKQLGYSHAYEMDRLLRVCEDALGDALRDNGEYRHTFSRNRPTATVRWVTKDCKTVGMSIAKDATELRKNIKKAERRTAGRRLRALAKAGAAAWLDEHSLRRIMERNKALLSDLGEKEDWPDIVLALSIRCDFNRNANQQSRSHEARDNEPSDNTFLSFIQIAGANVEHFKFTGLGPQKDRTVEGLLWVHEGKVCEIRLFKEGGLGAASKDMDAFIKQSLATREGNEKAKAARNNQTSA